MEGSEGGGRLGISGRFVPGRPCALSCQKTPGMAQFQKTVFTTHQPAVFLTRTGSSVIEPTSTEPPTGTFNGIPSALSLLTYPTAPCQITTFCDPAGTPLISNEPSSPVSVKNGWLNTMT